MDQRCHTSRLVTIIKCLVHHAVYCISLSCLLSFLCNPYMPFLIYEIFHLLVISKMVRPTCLCHSDWPNTDKRAPYVLLPSYIATEPMPDPRGGVQRHLA